MVLDNALQWRYNAFMSHEDTRAYLGVYGGIILPKAWCRDCRGYAFVRQGVLACCDSRIGEKPTRWKRESLASGLRQQPPPHYQSAQLNRQDARCFYCLRTFGTHVQWHKRICVLRIHWDHLIPFAYLQTNPEENFVAACQICNQLKGAKMFHTTEEARRYVAIKRSFI